MKTELEINKIIAEYMKEDFLLWKELKTWTIKFITKNKHCKKNLYTESLDSLVPVWEKLGICTVDLYTKHSSFSNECTVRFNKLESTVEYDTPSSMKSLYIAAAYATAEAIEGVL